MIEEPGTDYRCSACPLDKTEANELGVAICHCGGSMVVNPILIYETEDYEPVPDPHQ